MSKCAALKFSAHASIMNLSFKLRRNSYKDNSIVLTRFNGPLFRTHYATQWQQKTRGSIFFPGLEAVQALLSPNKHWWRPVAIQNRGWNWQAVIWFRFQGLFRSVDSCYCYLLMKANAKDVYSRRLLLPKYVSDNTAAPSSSVWMNYCRRYLSTWQWGSFIWR